MRMLSNVDGDEVSLVKRAANRRRFLLLKGDNTLDAEISDLLDVPWEREGSLLDEIRKDGADETTEKAVIAAIRLLKGVESELSPETIEKLGTELYSRSNPPLNSNKVPSPGDLTGSGSADADQFGSDDSDNDLTGSGTDGDLQGSGSGDKVAADSWNDDDADDMGKADFSDDQRKNLASQGQALPDGSYPIRNKSDLGNAIQAYGRAKDKGRAKAWIIRRAKALGATSMLPDSWVSKEDSSVVDDGNDDDERGTVGVQVPVRKEDGTWDLSGVPDESRPFFEHFIAKADKTESELAEAKEQLAKADDDLLTRSALEKAARFSHVAATDDLAPILKEASRKLDDETFEKLEDVLKRAEELINKGDVFTEFGRSSQNDVAEKNDAYSQIVAKADELIAKSENLTQEQAFDRAMRENPDLYSKYMAEIGQGV